MLSCSVYNYNEVTCIISRLWILALCPSQLGHLLKKTRTRCAFCPNNKSVALSFWSLSLWSLQGASSSGSPQGGRATSFELGELQRQDSSCQLDHLDLLQQHRSRSVETRGTSSVSVTVTSPRPERRAFLLKGCSPVGPSAAPSNTLTVSVPLQQHQYDKQDSLGSQFSPTIQVISR